MIGRSQQYEHLLHMSVSAAPEQTDCGVGGLQPLSQCPCKTSEAVISAGSLRAAVCLSVCLTRAHRAGGGMAGWGGFFFSLLNYKTEKYVIAENRRIGILFRLYQLAVLGYIIG